MQLSESAMPLANLIRDTAHAVVEALGLEQKDVIVEGSLVESFESVKS